MQFKTLNTHGIELDDYLRLFKPYETQLHDFKVRDVKYGARFALLFHQVARLLIQNSAINDRLPRTFVKVAQQFLANERDTVMHFSYEDNRHFFLSDLLDWLKHLERAQRLRDTRREL